ncbi:MAG TPA: arginine--tRNA ligase [Thermodesulfobacteriota bacterium]|nr:arginine--tRNA ligase [Thermodesulfobacteriota bacterium]
MASRIKGIIKGAIEASIAEHLFKNVKEAPDIMVERPRRGDFGDFSTNVAMLLAPVEKRSPREIAGVISEKISTAPEVEKAEVAGPGFINIFLEKSYWPGVLAEALSRGPEFGRPDVGRGEKVQVEFVSANPTGPLHIGHGRGAAVGDSLANILKAAGYDVTREFYINDAGRQVHILGESVRLRAEELQGAQVEFPGDFYRGEYVKEIARDYLSMCQALHKDEPMPTYQEFACEEMLRSIKKDLLDFGVEFDVWYSETKLRNEGLVTDTIHKLDKMGHLYELEGARWFRTTKFGDDKDRVIEKADGELTYFASDIAYHRNKLERGFTTIVDVWGADHHGYESRIRALIKALGHDEHALKVIFIQLVTLLRKGEPVPMGKREGEFVTLRQVMDEVGADACRFFFLMRKADAHLDFDLDLAKSQAPENPVYYVQYCHARIQSIFEFARESGVEVTEKPERKTLERLELKEETNIIKHLAAFEEVVEKSALAMEPHRITFYLMELAGLFHPYYNRNRVVTDDIELTRARLFLCRAVGTIVASGLSLLGVSAPAKM